MNRQSSIVLTIKHKCDHETNFHLSFRTFGAHAISVLRNSIVWCCKCFFKSQQAEFVLNADDDMFINMMQLMKFIEDNRSTADQKIIFGYLHKMMYQLAFFTMFFPLHQFFFFHFYQFQKTNSSKVEKSKKCSNTRRVLSDQVPNIHKWRSVFDKSFSRSWFVHKSVDAAIFEIGRRILDGYRCTVDEC